MKRDFPTFNRLYAEARVEIKDLDAIFERAAHEIPAQGNPPPVEALAAAAPSGEVASPGRILVGDIRDEVVRTVEEMYAHGLITSTGGNVSVRMPGKDEVWITPNLSFKGALRPDMLVRVDLEGNPMADSPYAPSSERMLHCAVYRSNPSGGAVIHSHAPKATILGLAGLPFLPISTEAAFIGEIPRIPFIMPGTVELADAVGAEHGVSEAELDELAERVRVEHERITEEQATSRPAVVGAASGRRKIPGVIPGPCAGRAD